MTTSLYVDNWYEVYDDDNKLLGWNVYSIPADKFHDEMTESDSEKVTLRGPIFKANASMPSARVVK